MKHKNPIQILCAAIAVALLAAFHTSASGSAGDYDLTWHTIDGGGGTSAGGGLTLSGTIGQPVAGAMSGGDFTLTGGFWTGAAPADVPACPGDLTGNGSVGVPDLLQLLSCWGPVNPGAGCEKADLTASGSVGVPDLLQLLANWGPCP